LPRTSQKRCTKNLVRNVDPEAPESVSHGATGRRQKKKLIDTELETQMNVIREIVEASSNARQKIKEKIEMALKKIVVAPKKEDVLAAVSNLEEVLKDRPMRKR